MRLFGNPSDDFIDRSVTSHGDDSVVIRLGGMTRKFRRIVFFFREPNVDGFKASSKRFLSKRCVFFSEFFSRRRVDDQHGLRQDEFLLRGNLLTFSLSDENIIQILFYK